MFWGASFERPNKRGRVSAEPSGMPGPTESETSLAGRKIREPTLDVGDDLESAIEVIALVGRHQARPEERAARRDSGVKRDVRVDAGLEQCFPEQHGLPVLSDD